MASSLVQLLPEVQSAIPSIPSATECDIETLETFYFLTLENESPTFVMSLAVQVQKLGMSCTIEHLKNKSGLVRTIAASRTSCEAEPGQQVSQISSKLIQGECKSWYGT